MKANAADIVFSLKQTCKIDSACPSTSDRIDLVKFHLFKHFVDYRKISIIDEELTANEDKTYDQDVWILYDNDNAILCQKSPLRNL